MCYGSLVYTVGIWVTVFDVHCRHICCGSLAFTVGTCVSIPWYSLLAHVLLFLGIHCGHMCYCSLVFTVSTCVTVLLYTLWAYGLRCLTFTVGTYVVSVPWHSL